MQLTHRCAGPFRYYYFVILVIPHLVSDRVCESVVAHRPPLAVHLVVHLEPTFVLGLAPDEAQVVDGRRNIDGLAALGADLGAFGDRRRLDIGEKRLACVRPSIVAVRQ